MTSLSQKQEIFGTGGQDLESHIRALRRYARALVGNTADADDLVQETLKRALTYVSRGQEIRDVRAYLLTMLHNVRIDMVKRQSRTREVLTPSEDIPLATMPSQNDSLVLRQVSEAVDRLPEEQREVLLLIGLEGMGYRETAEILGLPIGTIMSRLSRARSALKNALQLDGIIEIEAAVVRMGPEGSTTEAPSKSGQFGRAA